MTEREMSALFTLAQIKVLGFWQIENRYWPDVPEYAVMRRNSPWWLVKTPRGMVKIGWRKRVISIDWEDTDVRCVVTEDEVTKDVTMVHASSYARAVEYLTTLSRELATIKISKDAVAVPDSVETPSQQD